MRGTHEIIEHAITSCAQVGIIWIISERKHRKYNSSSKAKKMLFFFFVFVKNSQRIRKNMPLYMNFNRRTVVC